MCEIDIGNLKYTRNTYKIGSGTKLLFTFLSLKIFRHEEREAQSFYADCFYIVSSQPNQRTNSSGLGGPQKSTFFLPGKNSTLTYPTNAQRP